MKGIMDFSNYPTEHILYSRTNEKVVGKLKDELGGQNIDRIIVLKSKMFAIVARDDIKKVAKGVQSDQIQSSLS